MKQPHQEQHINERMVDLGSTENCGRAPSCATCGRGDHDRLEATTVDTTLGVACLTLCDGCLETSRLPFLSVPEAVRMVMLHCEHLGIDLDHMSELRHHGGDC